MSRFVTPRRKAQAEEEETMRSKGEKTRPRRISRRAFLRGLTTLAGAFVTACGPPRSTEQPMLAYGPQATPPIILPSPAPETDPQAEDLPLAEFLALSSVLTGVDNLSPALGRIYLQSIQTSDEFAVNVTDLYAQAGFQSDDPPTTVAAVEAAGLFDQEESRRLADKIIELWYTGIYTNAEGEETVATFVDALAWQTLAFTKPMTICGYPGFWSEAWEPTID